MKKGIILGTLAMAVVATSYSVSGTYAKYVSQIDLADEARVAKWSIDTTESGMKNVDLFQDSYVYNDNGIVVKSLDDDRVVAPGTKGQYTFALTGTIETNYRITLDVDGENTVRFTETDEEGETVISYDPLKFYLSESDAVDIDEIDEEDLLTFEELKEALANLYSGESDRVYAPGQVDSTSHTIYWKWDFEGNDTLDTDLGKDAVNHKVDLSIVITAEQTQDKATPVATETTPEISEPETGSETDTETVDGE